MAGQGGVKCVLGAWCWMLLDSPLLLPGSRLLPGSSQEPLGYEAWLEAACSFLAPALGLAAQPGAAQRATAAASLLKPYNQSIKEDFCAEPHCDKPTCPPLSPSPGLSRPLPPRCWTPSTACTPTFGSFPRTTSTLAASRTGGRAASPCGLECRPQPCMSSAPSVELPPRLCMLGISCPWLHGHAHGQEMHTCPPHAGLRWRRSPRGPGTPAPPSSRSLSMMCLGARCAGGRHIWNEIRFSMT